jgi:hypothetical protein
MKLTTLSEQEFEAREAVRAAKGGLDWYRVAYAALCGLSVGFSLGLVYGLARLLQVL